MKHRILLSCILAIISICAKAQNYSVGVQSVTWTDASRSNRSVPVEFHYPGTNTAILGDSFPIVVFGHGFQMTIDAYYPFADSLAKKGYIVALTSNEGGFSPVHANLAQDLIYIYNNMIIESNSNASSPLYHHVIAKGGIGGHSMGAGCTVLSAQYGNPATCYFTFAAATTNPSSISAAHLMTKPYLAFAGSRDCIAPATTNQIPMYDSSGAPCKVFIEIKDATHCQFAASSVTCNFGEGFSGCASTPLSRTDQINKTLSFLEPYLDYYTKGNCSAWTLFESRYAADVVDTLKRNCTNTIPNNPAITGVPYYCAGSSTTLTATPAGFGYNWSNSATTNAIQVNTAGTYGLTVTNNVCSVTATAVTVAQNNAPVTPSSIVAVDSVCSGVANVAFSVVSDPGATAYNWSLPAGWNITNGNNTNTITATSGNAGGTVSVIAQNACGTSTAVQKAIAVSASPVAPSTIISSDTVCSSSGNIAISVASDPAINSYTWTLPIGWNITSGIGSNAIQASPGANGGTISVTASNTCGTTPAVQKNIAVASSLNVISAILASDTVCSNIVNIAVSVVNDPQATIYNWTVPAGWVITSGSGTNSLQVTSGTTSGNISVSASNYCGATQPVNKAVAVVPSNLGTPGIITGSVSPCRGQLASYSIAPVTGANSYIWTYPTGWTELSGYSTDSVSVTPAGGSGTVQVQAVNGCGQSAAAVLSVTANDVPIVGSITGADSICVSDNAVITYMVSGNNADSLYWSVPNSWTIASGQGTGTLHTSPSRPGGTISVMGSNVCGISSPTNFTVAVIDTPAATITTAGNLLTASTGTSYQWYLNGAIINGANVQTYTATQTGNYSVEVGGWNGCNGTSQPVAIVVSGINALGNVSLLNIYPNPSATGSFRLSVTGDLIGGELTVFDATGRKVYSSTIVQTLTQVQTVELSKGVYLVRLETAEKTINSKWVVE